MERIKQEAEEAIKRNQEEMEKVNKIHSDDEETEEREQSRIYKHLQQIARIEFQAKHETKSPCNATVSGDGRVFLSSGIVYVALTWFQAVEDQEIIHDPYGEGALYHSTVDSRSNVFQGT